MSKKLIPEELRIGNLVLDSTKNTTKIESIIPDHNRIRYGIPLTEDWLKRFGFYHKDNRFILGILSISFVMIGRTGQDFGYFITGMFESSEIKYVHQLQNIYFSLAGTELTLTNK